MGMGVAKAKAIIGKPGGGPTQFRGDPRCGGGKKNGHGRRGGGGKCKWSK
jgi:hypothetical protein